MFNIFFLLLLFVCNILNCNDSVSADYADHQIEHLNWKENGFLSLSSSNAKLNIPEGHMAVIDKEAKVLNEILGNIPKEDLEVIVCQKELNYWIYFHYSDTGYVCINDWKIDPKLYLEAFSKGADQINESRRKKGINDEVHVLGWVREPTLDRENYRIRWAIELQVGPLKTINYVAILLGRYGYETITFAGNSITKNELETIFHAFQFNQGSRYEDYVEGDRKADYGISELVASFAVGNKITKQSNIFLWIKKLSLYFLVCLGIIVLVIKKYFFTEHKKHDNLEIK